VLVKPEIQRHFSFLAEKPKILRLLGDLGMQKSFSLREPRGVAPSHARDIECLVFFAVYKLVFLSDKKQTIK
jgi:hypothetical protein